MVENVTGLHCFHHAAIIHVDYTRSQWLVEERADLHSKQASSRAKLCFSAC